MNKRISVKEAASCLGSSTMQVYFGLVETFNSLLTSSQNNAASSLWEKSDLDYNKAREVLSQIKSKIESGELSDRYRDQYQLMEEDFTDFRDKLDGIGNRLSA